MNLGFISGFEEAINIIEGAFPAVSPSDSEEAIEVLVNRELADEIGLQVGEQYMLFRRIRAENGDSQRYQTPVRVSGVWEPADLGSDVWFYNPSTLETLFVIPEQSYHNRIAPIYPQDVNLGLWYLVMDGSDVTSSDVGRLLVRGRRAEQRVTSLMANSQLSISPLDALPPLSARQRPADNASLRIQRADHRSVAGIYRPGGRFGGCPATQRGGDSAQPGRDGWGRWRASPAWRPSVSACSRWRSVCRSASR